jgi:hypothetical protein
MKYASCIANRKIDDRILPGTGCSVLTAGLLGGTSVEAAKYVSTAVAKDFFQDNSWKGMLLIRKGRKRSPLEEQCHAARRQRVPSFSFVKTAKRKRYHVCNVCETDPLANCVAVDTVALVVASVDTQAFDSVIFYTPDRVSASNLDRCGDV